MKPEEKKVLNDSLSKLFKIDSETLASLYNEAGDLIDFSEVMKLDAERIAKYKSENDSQFKRGIKEGASKIENAVKEKYEIESDLVGVDLVDQLILKKVEEVKTSSTKDITKNPEYIKLQVSIDKQLKDRDKEWTAKLEAKEKEFVKTQLFEKVSKRGLVNLRKRNPILPSDPVKAQYWEDAYRSELSKRDYLENGEDLVVLDNGKPLQNAHGNPISFDEFTNDIADRIFEFPKAEDRSSPGNKDKPGAGNPNGFNPPKTEDEYIARQKDPKITPQQRIELTNYWTNLKTK
jgi:hypothetical protein